MDRLGLWTDTATTMAHVCVQCGRNRQMLGRRANLFAFPGFSQSSRMFWFFVGCCWVAGKHVAQPFGWASPVAQPALRGGAQVNRWPTICHVWGLLVASSRTVPSAGLLKPFFSLEPTVGRVEADGWATHTQLEMAHIPASSQRRVRVTQRERPVVASHTWDMGCISSQILTMAGYHGIITEKACRQPQSR